MLNVRDTSRFYEKNVGFVAYLVISAFLWLNLVFFLDMGSGMQRATKRVVQTRSEGPLLEP